MKSFNTQEEVNTFALETIIKDKNYLKKLPPLTLLEWLIAAARYTNEEIKNLSNKIELPLADGFHADIKCCNRETRFLGYCTSSASISINMRSYFSLPYKRLEALFIHELVHTIVPRVKWDCHHNGFWSKYLDLLKKAGLINEDLSLDEVFNTPLKYSSYRTFNVKNVPHLCCDEWPPIEDFLIIKKNDLFELGWFNLRHIKRGYVTPALEFCNEYKIHPRLLLSIRDAMLNDEKVDLNILDYPKFW